MFHLTRQVRFGINPPPDAQIQTRPTNSYAGYPSLTGIGHYFELDITLAGELDESSQYLRNIKEVDRVARVHAIPLMTNLVREHAPIATIPHRLFDCLRDRWPGASVHAVRLHLTPFLNIECLAGELPMVRLSQKFEFSATHRLHNPLLTDEQNRQTFGKCNNPLGHGHNYELRVTLTGEPDSQGTLMPIVEFERIVADTVISRFDHKNLNVELPEFRETIPSVENIAHTIYRLLKPNLATSNARLASVTVWETPKTWCEFSE